MAPSSSPIIPILVVLTVVLALVAVVFLLLKNRKARKETSQDIPFQELSEGQKKAFHRYFVDNDEALVSSLGNKYIENFIANGTLENGFSVISNKRVYFRGSCFTGNGKRFIKSDEERVVDLKDITGSGFIYQREVGILVSIALLIMVLLVAMGFMAVGWSSSGSGYTSADVKQAEQRLKEDTAALETAKKELPVLEEMDELNRIVTEYESNSDANNPWYSAYNEAKRSGFGAEGTRDFYSSILQRERSDLPNIFFDSAFNKYQPFSLDDISNYDTFIAEVPKIAESLGKDNYMNLEEWTKPLRKVFFAMYHNPDWFTAVYITGGLDGITGNETNGEFAEYLVEKLTKAKADVVSLFALSKPADYEQTYQNAKQQITQFEADNKEQTEKIATLERQVENTTSEIPVIKREVAENTKANILYFIGEAILASALVSVVLLFVNYLRRRRTFFEINYAGGKIAFNVSLYPKAEIDDFQKQLRRAKDLIQPQAVPQPVVATVATPAPVIEVVPASTPTNTKADELEKYATLLEKGLITKEEFDTLKKKAID